jgi:hypothetical protein
MPLTLFEPPPSSKWAQVAEVDLDLATRSDIQEWIVSTTDTLSRAEDELAARQSAVEAAAMAAALAGPPATGAREAPAQAAAPDATRIQMGAAPLEGLFVDPFALLT